MCDKVVRCINEDGEVYFEGEFTPDNAYHALGLNFEFPNDSVEVSYR